MTGRIAHKHTLCAYLTYIYNLTSADLLIAIHARRAIDFNFLPATMISLIRCPEKKEREKKEREFINHSQKKKKRDSKVQTTCLRKISMQRVSMHFCIPIARCRPSLMDRANENTITSHKSNLSILRLKENWFGSVCRIWERAFFRPQTRKKLVCTIFSAVIRNGALDFCSLSILALDFIFPPPTLSTRTSLDFPRDSSQHPFFHPARLHRENERCFFHIVVEHGRGRRTGVASISPRLVIYGPLVGSRWIGSDAIGIYDFRIGRDCRLLGKSLSWGNR